MSKQNMTGGEESALTPKFLLTYLQDLNEQQTEAHRRLRRDLQELDNQIVELNSLHRHHERLILDLTRTPVDVAKLRFTPSVVATIITMFLTIAGGMWASTWGLRSDVRDILTRMDLQSRIQAETLKLQDERAAALRDAIESMKRHQELQQYEIQGLKETILKGAKR